MGFGVSRSDSNRNSTNIFDGFMINLANKHRSRSTPILQDKAAFAFVLIFLDYSLISWDESIESQ